MVRSPSAAVDDLKSLNLSPKEFGGLLKSLTKETSDLMKLASKVYSLGKGQKLVFPNGDTIGKRELKSLVSQHNKKVMALKKHYTAHGKKHRRTRRAGKQAGFSNNAILVTDNMKAFFSRANLGPVDPRNPSSGPLKDQLLVGRDGITTRAIMTPVFSIYAHVNNMQQDPTNGQYLTATSDMDAHFQETYRRLEAAPQTYYKKKLADGSKVEDRTRPIPKFRPDHFRYANVQQIVADNAFPVRGTPAEKERPWLTALSDQQVAILKDPVIEKRLKEEQALVSSVLTYYRWKKEVDKGKTSKPFEQWA